MAFDVNVQDKTFAWANASPKRQVACLLCAREAAYFDHNFFGHVSNAGLLDFFFWGVQ